MFIWQTEHWQLSTESGWTVQLHIAITCIGQNTMFACHNSAFVSRMVNYQPYLYDISYTGLLNMTNCTQCNLETSSPCLERQTLSLVAFPLSRGCKHIDGATPLALPFCKIHKMHISYYTPCLHLERQTLLLTFRVWCPFPLSKGEEGGGCTHIDKRVASNTPLKSLSSPLLETQCSPSSGKTHSWIRHQNKIHMMKHQIQLWSKLAWTIEYWKAYKVIQHTETSQKKEAELFFQNHNQGQGVLFVSAKCSKVQS